MSALRQNAAVVRQQAAADAAGMIQQAQALRLQAQQLQAQADAAARDATNLEVQGQQIQAQAEQEAQMLEQQAADQEAAEAAALAAQRAAASSNTTFQLTPSCKEMALSSLAEMKGEFVYIVSKKTQSTLKMTNDLEINGLGGLGDAATWKVKKLDRKAMFEGERRPVVGFKNVKHGKFLAIKGGELTVGGGGEHCEFMVVRKAKAVLLIKHNNPKVRVGIKGNGQPKGGKQTGDGDAGRFFIFDCDDINGGSAPPAATEMNLRVANAGNAKIIGDVLSWTKFCDDKLAMVGASGLDKAGFLSKEGGPSVFQTRDGYLATNHPMGSGAETTRYLSHSGAWKGTGARRLAVWSVKKDTQVTFESDGRLSTFDVISGSKHYLSSSSLPTNGKRNCSVWSSDGPSWEFVEKSS